MGSVIFFRGFCGLFFFPLVLCEALDVAEQTFLLKAVLTACPRLRVSEALQVH